VFARGGRNKKGNMLKGNDALMYILRYVAEYNASDVYLTTGATPFLKVRGINRALGKQKLTPGQTRLLAYSMMSEEQVAQFERDKELNMAFWAEGIGRFRVNVYQQRGEVALVCRFVNSLVPSLATLGLPQAVADFAVIPRGLVLVVGSTGSGKSTTLASMVNHRASSQPGHILTLEDPIEFLIKHQESTVDQREIGTDTLSFGNALRNAMRQAPDMIVIGEIRDRETMQQAISYAETGHLCLSTLHANNANQAIKRVLNFFPEAAHKQLLVDLSMNLHAVVAQRLLVGSHSKLVLASEVMVRTPYIADLIQKGSIDEIRSVIDKSAEAGMQSFDQCLLALYKKGQIDQATALANADSKTDLSLKMRLGGAGR
jgi:twitching motility protein PilU